jgi:hypothetical protein
MTLEDRLGDHPLVKALIMSMHRADAVDRGITGVRYEDTWDANLVFDYWRTQPPTVELPYPKCTFIL